MILLAGVILSLTQILHGVGVVTTKKMKDTSGIHITYFVGLLLLFINGVMMPAALVDNQGKYHNPDLQ